ncbi:hypothetical protein N0X72_19500 [Streptomyces carpaticus]|uniref:Uncharacterized protein n=1 Tax=Streptomyces cheonanensis TaxID=312720 RepID=A0ABP5GQE8_9ACTN|nr:MULTISPECIES: hypothetical protein [Streptomyces]QKV70576.1 hypothetical protein HUT13_18715 [Streptomyces harbinensis]UWM51013.1 hypothetical protein N0X72_19500 [Streptomyces carpaticus]
MPSKIPAVFRAAVSAAALGAIGYYLWYGLTDRGDPAVYPSSWVGPQLMLPILGFIALSFVGSGMLARRLLGAHGVGTNSARMLKEGLLGAGTVLSVRPTGVLVNNRPVMRVELSVLGARDETFQAYAKVALGMAGEAAAIRPGAMLPVRYLPERRGEVVEVEVDFSGDTAAAQEALNRAMVKRGMTTPRRLDIAARGVVAQAVVRTLEVTGRVRDGMPELALELVVTSPGDGSSFPAHVRRFLPADAVPKVQVGRVVQVRYLPEAPDEVVLAFGLLGE